MPNAVYNPETCIRATIEAADLYGFDIRNIMFEVTEGEQILSHSHLLKIFQSYAAVVLSLPSMILEPALPMKTGCIH